MPVKSDLKVEKYVGTGNDFIIIDEQQSLPLEVLKVPRSEIVRKLCHRNFGVGADGVLFLSRKTEDSFCWYFYNSDGSTAEMCGNATRCVGRWAQKNLGLSKIQLTTAVGVVRIESSERVVTTHLDYLSLEFQSLAVEVGGRKTVATFVNTGVPHVVVEVANMDAIESSEIRDVIKAFRFHPETGSKGTNVTFLRVSPPAPGSVECALATTTFERGVEGFTLSCGTGVLAAAAAALVKLPNTALRILPTALCMVKTPGGELSVQFGSDWRGASLTGPADFVYNANVSSEIFSV